jgi:4-alpha-glucanotransferase
MPDRPSRFASGRHAGVLIPLFSIPSRASWGVGEIPDLPRFAEWVATAGLDIVQLLPVNEMAEGQNSPYSALSAMAIDPIFISVADVPEFEAAGGEAALPAPQRQQLERARLAETVQFRPIRELKMAVLREAFEAFQSGAAPDRRAAFDAFRARANWWLDDYALFRALHDEHAGRYWIDWDPGIRTRAPAAMADARRRLADGVLFRAWLQWMADEQWQRARAACAPVGIFGDFPFMVSGDSADVWARQDEFRVEARVGVPPDAFSATGQDWGLPACRWDVMAPGNYQWQRHRAERCAELYDGFRVDHLVGFYRTYVKEPDGTRHFIPADEDDQLAQGERLLRLFEQTGARIIVEDLGTVPDFVRESLARLGMPGLKVLRWERDWDADGQPFRDPAEYPRASVAISGTHDTDTLVEWWESAEEEERAAVLEIPALRGRGCAITTEFCDELRDGLLDALFASGSDLVLLPIQDVFGWRDRINTPAVVSDENWTWRLPWPVEELMRHPDASARAQFLRELAARTGRS